MTAARMNRGRIVCSGLSVSSTANAEMSSVVTVTTRRIISQRSWRSSSLRFITSAGGGARWTSARPPLDESADLVDEIEHRHVHRDDDAADDDAQEADHDRL